MCIYIYLFHLSVCLSICNSLKKICVCVYVCVYIYILGVAQYTDVTVRYVPRFGGHGSIRFRYNMKKKKSTMLGFFSFILNRQ